MSYAKRGVFLSLACAAGAMLTAVVGCDEGDTIVLSSPRIVHGVVDSDNTILRGTAFVMLPPPAGGAYDVSFDVPFSEAPTVVVTAKPDPSERALVAGVKNVTTDGFRVEISNTDYLPALIGAEFHFIAIGW